MRNVSRIIVGVITIPIVIAIIFYLPAAFFVFLMMVIAGVGLYEYFSLVKTDIAFPWLRELLSLVGVAFPLSAYYYGINGVVAVLFGVLMLLMILAMGGLNGYESSFRNVGALFLGFFFVAVPLSMAILILMSAPHGRDWALWMVIIVWAGDTGAFYLGTAFGKRRIYPKVSPKKSMEGVVGGIVSALIVGILARMFLDTGFAVGEVLILPPVLLVLGQLGDFSESMLKRGAGAKDSGRILAGHGGILDRIDSFLFTIPFFYIYLLLRS